MPADRRGDRLDVRRRRSATPADQRRAQLDEAARVPREVRRVGRRCTGTGRRSASAGRRWAERSAAGSSSAPARPARPAAPAGRACSWRPAPRRPARPACVATSSGLSPPRVRPSSTNVIWATTGTGPRLCATLTASTSSARLPNVSNSNRSMPPSNRASICSRNASRSSRAGRRCARPAGVAGLTEPATSSQGASGLFLRFARQTHAGPIQLRRLRLDRP